MTVVHNVLYFKLLARVNITEEQAGSDATTDASIAFGKAVPCSGNQRKALRHLQVPAVRTEPQGH